ARLGLAGVWTARLEGLKSRSSCKLLPTGCCQRGKCGGDANVHAPLCAPSSQFHLMPGLSRTLRRLGRPRLNPRCAGKETSWQRAPEVICAQPGKAGLDERPARGIRWACMIEARRAGAGEKRARWTPAEEPHEDR